VIANQLKQKGKRQRQDNMAVTWRHGWEMKFYFENKQAK
jgi:hypothetical protein